MSDSEPHTTSLQQTKQRNRVVLDVIDSLHRSILLKNLEYEELHRQETQNDSPLNLQNSTDAHCNQSQVDTVCANTDRNHKNRLFSPDTYVNISACPIQHAGTSGNNGCLNKVYDSDNDDNNYHKTIFESSADSHEHIKEDSIRQQKNTSQEINKEMALKEFIRKSLLAPNDHLYGSDSVSSTSEESIQVEKKVNLQIKVKKSVEFKPDKSDVVNMENLNQSLRNLSFDDDDSSSYKTSTSFPDDSDTNYETSTDIRSGSFNSSLSVSEKYFDCDSRIVSPSFDDESFYEDTSDALTGSTIHEPNCKYNKRRSKDKPVIHIIQEINIDNTVTSTIKLNKSKINSMKKGIRCSSTRDSDTVQVVKNNQKRIINENFCNEIIDQLNWDNPTDNEDSQSCISRGTESIDNNTDSDLILTTRLNAKPKYSGQSMGKLLAKRLSRIDSLKQNQKVSLKHEIEETVPPKKPPRTFAPVHFTPRNSSKIFSEDIEDLSPRTLKSVSFKKENSDELESINTNGRILKLNSNYVGWIAPVKTDHIRPSDLMGWNSYADKNDLPEILNMINYKDKAFGTIAQKNRKSDPEPQHPRNKVGWQAPKEDIDTVDGPINALKSRNRNSEPLPSREKFGWVQPKPNETEVKHRIFTPRRDLCSTPMRRSFHGTTNNLNCPQQNLYWRDSVSGHCPQCPQCHGSIMKTSANKLKTSFKNSAKQVIEKTKNLNIPFKKFFKSPNSKISNTCSHAHSDSEKSDGYLTPNRSDGYLTPNKSDTTERFNRDCQFNMSGKKSCKSLDFSSLMNTAPHTVDAQTSTTDLSKHPSNDSEKYMTAQCLHLTHSGISSNTQDFDFSRKIESPKKKTSTPTNQLKSFLNLSKTTFKTLPDESTYKSFKENDVEETRTILAEILNHVRSLTRARNSFTSDDVSINSEHNSTSSDIVDHIPNQEVKIDVHSEPIYSYVGATGEVVDDAKIDLEEPKIKEFYVDDGAFSSPRKYLMVNNDPNVIYSTVDKTLTPRKKSSSNEDVESFPSYESLRNKKNSWIVNDLVQSIQNFMDSEHNPSAPLLSLIDNIDLTQSENKDEILSEINEIINTIIESSSNTSDNKNSDTTPSSKRSVNGQSEINPSISTISSIQNDVEIGYDTVDYRLKEEGSQECLDANTIPMDERILKEIKSADMNNKSEESSPKTPDLNKSFQSTVNAGFEIYKGIKDMIRTPFAKKKRNELTEEPEVDDQNKNKSVEVEKHGNLLYNSFNSQHNQSIDTTDGVVLQLLDHIQMQHNLRAQLLNAIEMCHNTKEFQNSIELAEAQRLLLITNLEEKFAKRELARIDYGNESSDLEQENSNHKLGTAQVKYLEILLKDKEEYDEQFDYYYICVCSNGSKICSTEVKKRTLNHVTFQNLKMLFSELQPSYIIKIQIYVLKLKKQSRLYSHDSKYHLNKTETTIGCSPALGRRKSIKKFVPSPSKRPEFEYSQFRLHGELNLSSEMLAKMNRNLSLRNKAEGDQKNFRRLNSSAKGKLSFETETCTSFPTTVVTHSTSLLPKMFVTVHTSLPIPDTNRSGFLNICEASTNTSFWNYSWCKINTFKLELWNYPQDEGTMPPVKTINLLQCVNEVINTVSREKCPRPRTFAIDTIDESLTTKNYLVSANNQEELKEWLKTLNSILEFVQRWDIVRVI